MLVGLEMIVEAKLGHGLLSRYGVNWLLTGCCIRVIVVDIAGRPMCRCEGVRWARVSRTAVAVGAGCHGSNSVNE